MPQAGDLQGRVVLVTGGGAGLGQAISVVCAAEGAGVVVTGLGANVDDTVAQIVKAGGRARGLRADVTVRADVEAAVNHAVAEFGGLDAVVHNATSRHSSEVVSLADTPEDIWDDHVAVSLRGAYNCARAAFVHLQARKGRFIVMTSPAGMEGSLTLPAYGVVKGALRGFAKSLAVEWGPCGVSVACVSPLARTPALANAYLENPDLESRLQRLVPLGRVGDAETDVAPVVAFLISDGARYVTGQTIVVDGGRFTGL